MELSQHWIPITAVIIILFLLAIMITSNKNIRKFKAVVSASKILNITIETEYNSDDISIHTEKKNDNLEKSKEKEIR